MRVVCDNCGAVYKIADSKLSKEVNKATCKRCGHKIVIYKPGSAQASAASTPNPSEAEERTVIKSVEGLDKVGASTGKVPSIGSLTAELRAISLPGVQTVAPPRPAALSPEAGLFARGDAPRDPRPPSHAPTPGIPPKDSPATAVYHGPRPDLPPLPKKPGVPPAPPSREDDATRPMSKPPPAVVPQMPLSPSKHSAPKAPLQPQHRAASAAPAPPRAKLQSAPNVPPLVPNVPSLPTAPAAPKKGQPASSIIPPDLQTDSHATVSEGATSTQSAPMSSTSDGSAELGVVAGLGALGLFGVGATLAAPPVSTLGVALAGFGATACLFLPILSQRGRKSGQTFVAIFLGLLVGSAFGFLAHTRAQSASAPQGDILGGIPLEEPSESAEPSVADAEAAVGEDAAADVEPTTPDDGLTAEEREEARKFAEPGAPTAAEPSTPAPSVRQPESNSASTKREAPTPAPPKKEEPTPRDLKRDRRPVGPGAAPKDSSSSSGSSGPSPFVIDTIIRNNANINRCFTLEKARGTDISGKIYLKFSIAPDGGVSRARITTSRFAGTALDQCVSKEVNSLNFPPFDGDTQQVRYPFTVL